MSPVIHVHDLTKSFGAVRALDAFDLRVLPGEVHGFLGPNGAGKSTAIRILLGLLRADAGTARLLGADPWADAVALHRRLAHVPGDVALWPTMTGGEVIDVLAGLRGGLDRARKAELLERFDLDPTRRCRTYSKGNRQKVALVAALASDVELLVLDEPTSGLDPLMELVFQDCIRRASDRGTTVLLSSHVLAEVERLCDRVTIVRAGRSVQSGTLAEMRHLTRSTVRARVPDAVAVVAALEEVHDPVLDGDRLVLTVDDRAVPRVVASLAASGASGLEVSPPTLEELFVHHYDAAAMRGAAPSAPGGGR